MKPKEIIESEKEIARQRLSGLFDSVQSILDKYEEKTGDYIKAVTFDRIDVAGDGASAQLYKIGHVKLHFYSDGAT
jgi:hypothetical protein